MRLAYFDNNWQARYYSVRSIIMPLETMNIALPDAMKEFVLQRVAEGGFSTASEYVRELIRADQKQKAAERLDSLLLEGLEGKATPLTNKDWSDVRAQVSERLKKNVRK